MSRFRSAAPESGYFRRNTPLKLDARGQASFEFILVVVFVLAILLALVVPLGKTAQNALDDVFRASTMASNARQVESAIELAHIQGGDSTQWISLYLPKDSNVDCHISTGAADPNRIIFQVKFNKRVFDASGSEPAQCISAGNQMNCTKSVIIPSTLVLSCQGSNTQSSLLEAGESGFSQNMQLRYFNATVPPAVPVPTIDFSTR